MLCIHSVKCWLLLKISRPSTFVLAFTLTMQIFLHNNRPNVYLYLDSVTVSFDLYNSICIANVNEHILIRHD